MGSSDLENWICEAKDSMVGFFNDHVEQPVRHNLSFFLSSEYFHLDSWVIQCFDSFVLPWNFEKASCIRH